MRTPNFISTRKWLTATSLAAILALSAGGILMGVQQSTAQISVIAGAPASFADLVDAVKPAVVSISVEGSQEVRRLGNENFDFQFPDLPPDHPFRRFFDQFERGRGQGQPDGQPRTRRFQAAGSGFIISADGLVVTNNHVVENADNINITDEDGNEHVAILIGTDRRTDLALLQIEGASDLPFVEFADTQARVGDWVVAVGNPFGLGGTVTAGIVSARGRDISANSYGDFIQIDAAINGGNSGGPTFNLSGQVVGVNTAIFSPNGGNVGIAFAIPAKTVAQVITDLMDDGLVTRGFLGVGIQNVTEDIANSIGLNRARGAIVTSPTPDGPAENAGIVAGDVILKVNGELIDDTQDLIRTVATLSPDTSVEVIVWRDGHEVAIQVILAKRPDENQPPAPEPVEEPVQPETPEPTSVGLTLLPNETGDGVIIEAVESGSSAAEKGFVQGEIILEADGQSISSSQEFEAIVTAAKNEGRDTILIKSDQSDQIRFVGLPI